MLKLWKAILASTAVVVLTGVVAIPVTASAATLWVSNAIPSPPYNSCTNNGYTSIQTAIKFATPHSTINVCGGTYAEQLEIKQSVNLAGTGNPTVKLPVTPKNSETTCDEARNTAAKVKDQDLVSICTTESVTIKGLTLEARWPEGICNDGLYGILVAGGATLNATSVKVDGAGVEGSGCQGGVGIQVGFKNGGQVGHATLTSDSITNYQKNGITVDGPGSKATITTTTITGAGPVDQGQNGIQVSREAVASISKATISTNECSAPQCGYATPENWEEDAAGVLFYLPGASSTVSNSTLNKNNIGVEYVSESLTRPETPQVTLTSDQVTGGYASVQLNQGNAKLEKDKLIGGLIGIDVNSYWGEDNTYAPEAAAVEDKVEGTEAAVQVESSLGTLPGRLTFKKGQILGSITNEDPMFRIG